MPLDHSSGGRVIVGMGRGLAKYAAAMITEALEAGLRFDELEETCKLFSKEVLLAFEEL